MNFLHSPQIQTYDPSPSKPKIKNSLPKLYHIFPTNVKQSFLALFRISSKILFWTPFHKSPKVSLYNLRGTKSSFLKSLINSFRKISLSCFYFRHALLLEWAGIAFALTTLFWKDGWFQMSSDFASRLSTLRHEHGLSQKEVAARLGISPQSCSHYENGRRVPDIFMPVSYTHLDVYKRQMVCLMALLATAKLIMSMAR